MKKLSKKQMLSIDKTIKQVVKREQFEYQRYIDSYYNEEV